jgi:hypothetical protein
LIFSDELAVSTKQSAIWRRASAASYRRTRLISEWEVFLKTFADFTLTEQFEEALTPAIQLLILGQT